MRADPCDGLGVGGGDPALQDTRAGCGGLVGHVDQVFHRDGKAAKGAGVFAPCKHPVGAVGLVQRVCGDVGEGMQARVQGGDAVKHGLRQCAGCEGSAAQHCCGFGQGKVGRVGHSGFAR